MVNREERWNKNLEHLMSGGFGDTSKPETLLNYWYAQESAGYPYAKENVKYFEGMCGIERKPLELKKIHDSIEITDEMRKLADEMGKAISTAYEERYLADERKLEAVLKANGWCKVSEIFEEIAKIIQKYDKIAERDKSEYGELIVMDIGCAIGELEKKYTEGKG